MQSSAIAKLPLLCNATLILKVIWFNNVLTKKKSEVHQIFCKLFISIFIFYENNFLKPQPLFLFKNWGQVNAGLNQNLKVTMIIVVAFGWKSTSTITLISFCALALTDCQSFITHLWRISKPHPCDFTYPEKKAIIFSYLLQILKKPKINL